jgi:hypothetical protein
MGCEAARTNFALSVGLRYQFTTVPTEVNHRIESNFTAPEIERFIQLERQRNAMHPPGESGLEKFLAGRKKIYREDRNNFAPQVAFAFDPFGKGEMSIRGGFGIYYDQIPGSVISQSRTLFPSFITLNLAGLTSLTQDFEFLGWAAEPGMAGGRRFHLLGALTLTESSASSTYHSLQFQLNRRFTRGIEFTTAYTWSHAIDDVSDTFALAGASSLPQDSLNLRVERADASFDVRQRFVFSLIWNLPLFEKNKLLRGWQIASIGTFQTGQPYTVLACCDVNLDGNLTDRLRTSQGIERLDRGPIRLQFPDEPIRLQANMGVDGAVGRNTFRAPGIATVDLAMNKSLRLGERQKIELRIEFFNAFNRTSFGIPVHVVGSPSLGRSVDTRVPSRTTQFALKYVF